MWPMRTLLAPERFIQLLSWEQSFRCSKMAAAWVTLFVPGCAITHSEGRLFQALGNQGSLPTAKYIINLGVMPGGAFAGHPSPRTPLAPITRCQTMTVSKEERTRLLCPGQKLLDGAQQRSSSHSLQAEPTKSPGLPRGQSGAIPHLEEAWDSGQPPLSQPFPGECYPITHTHS